MHNFDMVKKDKSYNWLVYGYDGWGGVELPDNSSEVWESIVNEYSELTKSNTMFQYLDLCSDESDMLTRVEMANALIYQIESRPNMFKETFKAYCKELRRWKFYYNEGKNRESELKRLKKQLEVVVGKIKLLQGEKKEFEQSNKGSDLITTKVRVQNIIKRDIDLRKISVKEWIVTLNTLPKNK